MSLPSSQQRVLDRIEGRLRDSDPRLMALFVIFTKLTRDEEMPGIGHNPQMEAPERFVDLMLSWLRTKRS